MKKLIVLVLCLCVLGVVGVMAENFESVVVNVTTSPATGDDYIFSGGTFSMIIATSVPKTLISHITLTTDDSTVAQTVTLWDGWTNGTSSAAVSKIWEWDLDAMSSSATVIIQEYFLDGDRGFLKADYGLYSTITDENAGVTLSIHYK